MDLWIRLKTPGLIVSVVLHVFGFYFLIKASSVDSGKLSRDVALQRQLQGSDYVYDPKIREKEIQFSQSMAVYIWSALGCLLISLGALSPTALSLVYVRNSGEAERGTARSFEHGKEPEIGIYHSLKSGLDELESCLKQQSRVMGAGISLQLHEQNIRMLQGQANQTSQVVLNSHSLLQKTAGRLHTLIQQCRDSANYTATNRIDWKKNNLANLLNQVRQNHDQLLDRSKTISSMHASTMRLLQEAILSEQIIHQKVARVQEKLKEVQSGAHAGHKSYDQLVANIGEAREDIQNAGKLVNNFRQKSESLSVIISRVDDLAEKINRHVLSLSLECSRGEGAKDFFLVGAELRTLASQFHSQSIQLHDFTDGAHPDLDKAQHFLSEAAQKSEQSFFMINRFGESYRNDISSARYALSDLTLLNNEVSIHMMKLNETRELGDGTAQISADLSLLLDTGSGLHRRFNEESSNVTLHCEKLSNLLTKQHYELSHCEKLMGESSQILSSAVQYANEMKQNAAGWSASLNSQVAASGTADSATTPMEELFVHKIEDFKKIFARLEESLEKRQEIEPAPKRVQKFSLATVVKQA